MYQESHSLGLTRPAAAVLFPVDMDNKQECPICVSMVSAKKTISCPACEFTVCCSCLKQNLLSSMTEPHCMNCKKAFPRSFLANHMPKTFMTTTYKLHRQEILKNQYQARFPTIQQLVLLDKERQKKLEKNMEISLMIRKLQHHQREHNHWLSQYNTFEAAILQGDRTVQEVLEAYKTNRLEAMINNPAKNARQLRSCVGEDCRGFLDTAGSCGLCEQLTCLACNVLIVNKSKESHQCQPQDVENWKLIRNTTTACPTCTVRIHRVSGCLQMWCTQCRTAFNYKTGEVERGPIHNPVYFDWARKNPHLAAQDGVQRNRNNLCVERYPFPRFSALAPMKHLLGQKQFDHLALFLKCITDLHIVKIPEFDRHIRIAQQKIVDAQKKFLRKEVDEAALWKRIQEVDKQCNMFRDLVDITRTVIASGSDICWHAVNDRTPSKDQSTYQSSVEELVVFINTSYQQCCDHYNSSRIVKISQPDFVFLH